MEPEGQLQEIASLGPGDCFGEMALLTGEPGSADIQAMTDLTLLKLSRNRFDQLIHQLAFHLAHDRYHRDSSLDHRCRCSGIRQSLVFALIELDVPKHCTEY